MRKLIAISVVGGGIALFTLACADQPAGPPVRATPSRPSFGASTPFNNAGQCLGNDAILWEEFVEGIDELSSPDDLNCTSNDVEVASVVATEMLVNGVWIPLGSTPVLCVVGEVITLRMTANLTSSAADRTDVGLWLATDGGDAIDGSCNHYNLPVSPLPAGVTNPDGDSCGNVTTLSTPAVDLGEVSLVCAPGQSGQLEISTCLAWSLESEMRECPAATVSGPDGFRAGTLPSTVSKCNCGSSVIQTAPPQTGSITIVKDVVPNDDPQDFAFTTSGSGLSGFSLDDDTEPTLQSTRTFSGLAGGTYTVTETATPGFDVTAVTCTAGGTGSVLTRTATISLVAGANVQCIFENTKRPTALVNKRENGVLPLTRSWEFELRTGASTSAAGTVVASGTADVTTGAVSFACMPDPNTACENVGGVAHLVPGAYQLCEINMPAGYTNNIASPPGFTPAGETPEGGDNATECANILLVKGETGVPTGVPDPIDNVAPPASGGSIALQTGSFTLANDALSGTFGIRNASAVPQQVFVTSLTIVNATFRDGPTLVQAAVTGCVFTPLPILIPASGSQTITLSGCQVTPSVHKELMFTVRATINGGDQPFYDRTYKVRTQ